MKHDTVFAGRNVDGLEITVRFNNFCRLPVDGRVPLRMMTLGKHEQSWLKCVSSYLDVAWAVDHDCQVALYEWRAGKKPLDDFLTWDLNDDGFITPEEAAKVMASKKGSASMADGSEVRSSPGASDGSGDRGKGGDKGGKGGDKGGKGGKGKKNGG